MKRAVSISIGSSTRDKAVVVNLLGEQVSIERIGTDGDMEKAAQLYRELDGKVEAFGVGGADLGLMVDKKWYPLHSVKPMVRFVEQTPLVDGAGLKNTLENQLAPFMDRHFGEYLQEKGKKALITSGADRWGMAASFANAGYECVFGDLMFRAGHWHTAPVVIKPENIGQSLDPSGEPAAFRVGLPDGREAGNPRSKMGEILHMGDGYCRRLSLYQAAYAGTPGW